MVAMTTYPTLVAVADADAFAMAATLVLASAVVRSGRNGSATNDGGHKYQSRYGNGADAGG